LSTRTPWGRFCTSIGTRPENAAVRWTARVMDTRSPGWITTRRGRAVISRVGGGVTVIQPPDGPPGSISCVWAGSLWAARDATTSRATTRHVGAEKAGAELSAESARMPLSSSPPITAGVAVIPGGSPWARTSTGESKPSRRITVRCTSAVPPRGMFGFSVPSTTWNDGCGRRRTR
jgi:hypothetical protein